MCGLKQFHHLEIIVNDFNPSILFFNISQLLAELKTTYAVPIEKAFQNSNLSEQLNEYLMKKFPYFKMADCDSLFKN